MEETKRLVLIVEDEISLAQALSDVLVRIEGVQILLAKDGEAGFKMAQEYQPDLILLDLILPKMDGMMVLSKMREQEWGKLIPVIVLTNLSVSEKEGEARRLGVRDFVVKTDMTLEEITVRVKKELGL